MNNILIDQSFDQFLDSEEAEDLFGSQFSIFRKIFVAGYRAGQQSKNNKEGQIVKLELIDNRVDKSNANSR